MTTERQRRGAAGEDAAAAHLQAAGFRVLERNWRQGSLELDLVCRQRDTLVFVEVRTRAEGGKVGATESFTPAKQRAFLKAVRAYLAATEQWDKPCRCDLVSVTAHAEPAYSGQSSFTVEHCPHVIDLTSGPVGGGNTPWQPW